MTKIISIINHKGGVGKTTSSANIGAGLALKGKKTLLLDFDPQANLTMHFSLPLDKEPNIYQALRGETKLPVTNIKENLDIVTSSLDLAAAEIELSTLVGREHILRELLEPIKSNYDFILIDCPPSLGLLTINALAASNNMIVPIEMGSFAVAGMTRLFEIISLVKKRLNPELSDYSIIMTKVDTRKILHRDIKDTVTENFDSIFETSIRTNVALEEATAQGTDIFSYDANSSGASDYDNVCNELIEKFK